MSPPFLPDMEKPAVPSLFFGGDVDAKEPFIGQGGGVMPKAAIHCRVVIRLPATTALPSMEGFYCRNLTKKPLVLYGALNLYQVPTLAASPA